MGVARKLVPQPIDPLRPVFRATRVSKIQQRNLEDAKDPYWGKLADRLREAREISGCTMEEIYKTSGIYPQELYRLEHGKQRPGLNLLRRLALAYDVPLSELLDADKKEDWSDIPQQSETKTKSWYWRITDRQEMKLVGAYRLLLKRERRLVQLMIKLMPRARSPQAQKKFVGKHGQPLPQMPDGEKPTL